MIQEGGPDRQSQGCSTTQCQYGGGVAETGKYHRRKYKVLTSWITLSANTPNPCLVPWSSLYSEHQPEDLVDISVPMIEAANSAAKQENGSAESCKPQLPSLPLRATKIQQLHRPITQRVTLPWNSKISRGQDKTQSVTNSTTRPWIEKDIFRAKTK